MVEKSTRRLAPPPIAYLLLLALGAGYWWSPLPKPWKMTGNWIQQSTQVNSGSVKERISSGKRLLVTAEASPAKQAGVKALDQGDYATAIAQFETARSQQRSDPETLIYLNNARIGSGKSYRIGVSVPIGGNLDVAQEMLRGVAQAQDDINRQGGVNGVPLQVVIANDDNNPEIAKQLAATWIQDPTILAVVGPNASDTSIAAAPVYNAGELVMITPTSKATKLSNMGPYIFRTVPSMRAEADTLSRYVLKTARMKKVAICSDSRSQASQSIREELMLALQTDGGQVVSTPCDFSAPDYDPERVITQAIRDGAEATLLLPTVQRISQAAEFARANRKRLPLLGESTLYTMQTLQLGQSEMNGMVLAVAWHPEGSTGSTFPAAARKLWGGQVNWRTATAYDAVQAIATGLQTNPTRLGLQQALSNPQFSTGGVLGELRFLPSGDRVVPSVLVQVKPGRVSGTGYDFVPLKP